MSKVKTFRIAVGRDPGLFMTIGYTLKCFKKPLLLFQNVRNTFSFDRVIKYCPRSGTLVLFFRVVHGLYLPVS